MGAYLEVEVLRRPGRRDPSEAQGIDREVGAGGSVERIPVELNPGVTVWDFDGF